MLCFSHYVQTQTFKFVFTFLSLFLVLVFFIHFLQTSIFVVEVFLSVYIGTCNETKNFMNGTAKSFFNKHQNN
jgi:hypothetical protein